MRSRRPLVAVLSLAFLGALASGIARYAYLADILVDAGVNLDTVPFATIAIEVMELPRFALYGAAGGAVVGVLLALLDLLRSGRKPDYTWAEREVSSAGADELIKRRKAQAADEYLGHRHDGSEGDKQA